MMTRPTMKKFPHETASKSDVQNWLSSWFTDRNIKASKLASDKSLWQIIRTCRWTGKTIRESLDSTLEKDLADFGLVDYVATRIMVDIAYQRGKQKSTTMAHEHKISPSTTQYNTITYTTETLPSAKSRENFIQTLPPSEASSTDVSEWLCSWFHEFNLKGKGFKAETTIKKLGLDGNALRIAMQEDRAFMVGTLHLQNGFSWNHMFGIADDVRKALKKEERDNHGSHCRGDCEDLSCMLARSELNNGSARKRKLKEALPLHSVGSGRDSRKTKAAREGSFDMNKITARYDRLLEQTDDMAVQQAMEEKLYNVEDVTSRYGPLWNQPFEELIGRRLPQRRKPASDDENSVTVELPTISRQQRRYG